MRWEKSLPETVSPAYIFQADLFEERCRKVKEQIGDIPLTFSIKANPFLLSCIPSQITHVEVCSPGELAICRSKKIAPESVLYSGVCKEAWDIKEAVAYGVDILTAESLHHLELEHEVMQGAGRDSVKVLLRLTSGNQFGMSKEDIRTVIANRQLYPKLDIYGIHYYSGTMKKTRQIQRDIKKLDLFLQELFEDYGYEPKLVEYGPGLSVSCFEPPYEERDWQHFTEAMSEIREFADRYPVGLEMGRFLAAPCGSYVTRIEDIKQNSETDYLICDGGIQHLKYHGQTMAMQVPPIRVCRTGEEIETTLDTAQLKAEGLNEGAVPDAAGGVSEYMICGSLCTVADVLVRSAALPAVQRGDYLVFGRCGAYSVTEGISLFLSRRLPRIYLYQQGKGYLLLRDFVETAQFNQQNFFCLKMRQEIHG